MDEVQLEWSDTGKGAFVIREGETLQAEMVFAIYGTDMTVFHTEVFAKDPKLGLGRKLLAAMVAYVRAHGLKVIPLCPFVHAQFKRHHDEYADIWKNTDGD